MFVNVERIYNLMKVTTVYSSVDEQKVPIQIPTLFLHSNDKHVEDKILDTIYKTINN